MARRNWPLLYKNFLATGLEIKQWCEQKGIPYNSARIAFKKLQQSDADGVNHFDQPKKLGGKRKGAGAPKGNKNGLSLDSIMNEAFPGLWQIAQQFDRKAQHATLQAQALSLRVEMNRCKVEIDRLVSITDRDLTEIEHDDLSTYKREFESSDKRLTFIIGQISIFERNASMTDKTKVETTGKRNDNKAAQHTIANTKLQGELLQANIERTKKQAELTTKQIKELDGDGTDHDDIDDLFDEIMNERDGLLSDVPEDA